MEIAPRPKEQDLEKVRPFFFEIPSTFWRRMRVPARVYTSSAELKSILIDRSLTQLVNTTTLYGVVGFVVGMPDIHEGYGVPVGGVFATKEGEGIISPGAIGYDINCGVRLLLSQASFGQVERNLEKLTQALFRNIPSGLGRGGQIILSENELGDILEDGAVWAVTKGFGEREDLEAIEEKGSFRGADPSCVSAQAKKRARNQLGSLGSGNHFVEVVRVEKIYDEDVAKQFGLTHEQICFLIHSGSRSLGHQVASDYIQIMLEAGKKYGIDLPDKELASAPQKSVEAQNYLAAMRAAANFAWANRQILGHLVRQVWKKEMKGVLSNRKLTLLYDVAHNIGKFEEHEIDGQKRRLLVHRKGATRAFPPGHPDLPARFQKTGQPVLLPGSMGTASYVLVGARGSMKLSFGSSAHGAGRAMSRKEAKRKIQGRVLQQELRGRGIIALSQTPEELAEEAPQAYKDVDQVVEVVEKLGLSRRVARLTPLGVIKGG